MSAIRCILVVVLIMCSVCNTMAMMQAHDFSNKSVTELLELLESKDSSVRADAAVFIGFRYRKPGIVVNPPTYKTWSPETPLPDHVIPSLIGHLKSDPDRVVRIASVDALCELKFRTNTTPALMAGLDDHDEFVRVRVCSALITISQDYSESLVEKVIPTLMKLLRPDGEIETTWYAAWIAGQLGSSGKPLIPALEKTAKHKSSKVRHYVHEALSKIQMEEKKDGKADGLPPKGLK